MFFSQVYHTTTSFTWRIIGTMSPLISITYIVNLIFKRRRCFFWANFFTSGILSSFELLIGLNGYWIVLPPVIKVSEAFFLLFLRGIHFWSEVTLDKLSLCQVKKEILKLSLLMFVYDGFIFWWFFQINELMKWTLVYFLC